MADIDSIIQFWIPNATYVWVPGETPQTCKRYYILHHNAVALFDKHGNIMDKTMADPDIACGAIPKSEDFTMLPNPDNDMVRNAFLVCLVPRLFSRPEFEKLRDWYGDNIEIRIEGKPAPENYKQVLFPFTRITIVAENYRTRLQLYSWRLGNPHGGGIFVVNCEIGLQTRNGRQRKYKNLAEAQRAMKLSQQDLQRIHTEALENAYFIILRELDNEKDKVDADFFGQIAQQNIDRMDARLDAIEEMIEDTSPGHRIRAQPRDYGWTYFSTTLFDVAQVVYETLVGRRRIYPIRGRTKK